MISSIGVMKILPSVILPVRAALVMASTACSTRLSSSASSIFTLGRKSTTYSAPRYNSVWPFWRPKPLTSVTVIPCTPTSDNAVRTSSSLNGFTTAVINFIREFLLVRLKSQPVPPDGDYKDTHNAAKLHQLRYSSEMHSSQFGA